MKKTWIGLASSMSVQVLFGCLFLFLRSYTQGIIRIGDSSSAHTFWLNKLHGIIIKQQQQRFSLFISSVCVCVAGLTGVIYGKRYRANESYCKFRFYISVLTLAFVKTRRLTYVRTNGIRNRNPSYGYYLCCCCCCCLYGLIIILNSLGYFSSASQAVGCRHSVDLLQL